MFFGKVGFAFCLALFTAILSSHDVCALSNTPHLKLSSESILFLRPFFCQPIPSSLSDVEVPLYSLCLKFSPLSVWFFPPAYIPTFKKESNDIGAITGSSEANTSVINIASNTTNCTLENYNTIFPALNFSLSFVIPRSVKNLTIAGLFALTDSVTKTPLERGFLNFEAMRCAITYVNNNSTILPDTKLNFQLWDTHGMGSYAINAAYMAMQSNVTAFVGLTSYEEVFGVSPIISPSLLALVSGEASSSFLNDPVLFPSFYRTVPGDQFVAVSMLELFHTLNWNQFAIVFGNDFIGASGLEAIYYAIDLMKEQGYSPYLLCETTLSLNSVATFNEDSIDFINCIKITKARAIVLWTDVEDAAKVIEHLVNAGSDVYTQDTIFVAPYSWSGPEVTIQLLSELSNGVITEEVMMGSFLLQPRAFSQQRIRQCLSVRNPASVNNVHFIRYWQFRFKCTIVGSPFLPMLSSDVIRDLDQMPVFPGVSTTVCDVELDKRNPNISLCSCPLSDTLDSDNLTDINPYLNYVFDATMAVALAYHQLLSPCDIMQPCDLPYFTNKDLLAAINETLFNGLTGLVSWLGHDRNHSDISVFQFCDHGHRHISALSNFSGVYIFPDNLCFRTTSIPMSVIVPEEANFSSTIGLIMVSLFIAFNVLVLCLAGIFWYFREREPILSSGLYFLELLLLGSLLVSFSAVLWTLDPTAVLCGIKVIVMALGYSLIFGTLVAKVYRSFEVSCVLRDSCVGIGWRILLVFSGCIFVFNFLFIILLYLIAGRMLPTLEQDLISYYYFYVACRCVNGATVQETIVIIQITLNVILVIGAFCISVRNLAIHSPHGENETIAIVLLDLAIVTVSFMIIYFNTGFLAGTIQSQYIIRSVGTLYLLVFTVGLITIPKLLALIKSARHHGEAEGNEDTGDFLVTETSPSYLLPDFDRVLASETAQPRFRG